MNNERREMLDTATDAVKFSQEVHKRVFGTNPTPEETWKAFEMVTPIFYGMEEPEEEQDNRVPPLGK
ncbi:hypothetical protein FUAX_09940 [Fulvitalea axinellae]|uniref:Uncharacterized protein n=1 Tax=Fulvitalea axinellae TaxID=1182444 RepID=A0AAU9CKW2_9BACT|nr:hypothetical protein FUAX_09940 [Fulvitalea axinellae]